METMAVTHRRYVCTLSVAFASPHPAAADDNRQGWQLEAALLMAAVLAQNTWMTRVVNEDVASQRKGAQGTGDAARGAIDKLVKEGAAPASPLA